MQTVYAPLQQQAVKDADRKVKLALSCCQAFRDALRVTAHDSKQALHELRCQALTIALDAADKDRSGAEHELREARQLLEAKIVQGLIDLARVRSRFLPGC